MILRLRAAAAAAVAAHARATLPNECCGLLLGTGEQVEEAYRAGNLHEGPTRFLIDPCDHFAAIRLARARGWRVIGAYHSHPNGPDHPSPRDRAGALDPELVHVIAWFGGGGDVRLGAWRLHRGNFAAVRLVPVP